MKITNEERAVYQNLKKRYGKTTMISWNSLRLESANLGTQGQIQFVVNENQNSSATPQQVTETRLKNVDQFICTRLGVYLGYIGSGLSRKQSILMAYPNAQVLGATPAGLIQSFYTGANLYIQINKRTVYPAFDMYQFYKVGTAQQLVALTQSTALPAGSSGTYLRDDWNETYNGEDMVPTLRLSGNQDNNILINLAESTALAPTSGTLIAVCMIRGFLLQNVNSGMTNKTPKTAKR